MNNLLINNLQWSESNLSVTKFQNGDDISFADNPYNWTKLNYRKQPAYSICPFIGNDLIPRLGLIYNIYAVMDNRGLIPVGQRLPNFSEWASLNNYFQCCTHPYDSETETILDDSEIEETILNTCFKSITYDTDKIKIKFSEKNFFNWFAFGKVSPSGSISEFGESVYFWANEFDKNSYSGFVKFSKTQIFKTELNYFHRQEGFYIRTIQEHK